MTGTKYTDLEKGETEQLTTKEIKESNKIEVCWWCALICPIIIGITFCTFMLFVIINEYKRKHTMEHEKEFNYIRIILCWIGLVICGCPMICHTLQLIIGYICHSSEKK